MHLASHALSPACTRGVARHRPNRPQPCDQPGVLRARCRGCGLKLMRTAISRHWIIADRLG
ncbi:MULTISPECIES: hypothetical protein [unclassified Sphingomonas]|uniref:hypothetical protein n=1 Tax=unclassified Sphingomonas TaxID=196159 RepID=UPI00226A3AE1|nr:MULTISPECIES: hypothetical protein [unclassified Sphingomonas]